MCGLVCVFLSVRASKLSFLFYLSCLLLPPMCGHVSLFVFLFLLLLKEDLWSDLIHSLQSLLQMFTKEYDLPSMLKMLEKYMSISKVFSSLEMFKKTS